MTDSKVEENVVVLDGTSYEFNRLIIEERENGIVYFDVNVVRRNDGWMQHWASKRTGSISSMPELAEYDCAEEAFARLMAREDR